MTRRLFLRLPVFDTTAEAVAWCAERGYKLPTLHRAQSAPVVGVVELDVSQAAARGSE
jgi:hypothetical protein